MPNAEELKTQGNQAFARQEFKKAAKIYRDAIKLDSNNPVLFSNRALCFIKVNDWDRALRDCTEGLSLKPDSKTKVKLLYREAIVYKNLNDIPNAKGCLEEVLQHDPSNTAATNELKSIDSTQKPSNKKIKLQRASIPIPITEVDSLPKEFQELEYPSKENAIDLSKTELSKRVNESINELFGSNENRSPPNDDNLSNTTKSTHFTEKPSMYMLSTLNSLPENKKVDAYKYLINLSSDYYDDVFGSTGIDSEFLVFFMEAAAYTSTHNLVDHWETQVYNHLLAFSKIRRFGLSLLFCSSNHINELILNVSSLSDTKLLQNYQALLAYS